MRSLRTAPNGGAETGTEESATVTRYRPDSRVSPTAPGPHPQPELIRSFRFRASAAERRRRRLELSEIVNYKRRRADPIAIERRAADHRRTDGVVSWLRRPGIETRSATRARTSEKRQRGRRTRPAAWIGGAVERPPTLRQHAFAFGVVERFLADGRRVALALVEDLDLGSRLSVLRRQVRVRDTGTTV